MKARASSPILREFPFLPLLANVAGPLLGLMWTISLVTQFFLPHNAGMFLTEGDIGFAAMMSVYLAGMIFNEIRKMVVEKRETSK